ncbi:MAG: hypothetical protein JSU93_00390 [Methanobacteriota archaeon]|nr:MAG: hypothetical protein JSU93_00390 [Euryarchaeota archaeon]
MTGIPPVPPKMPYRFHMRMNRWGAGIERRSFWSLLLIFLMFFVAFMLFLLIV